MMKFCLFLYAPRFLESARYAAELRNMKLEKAVKLNKIINAILT
jgi:hypothetical protein